MLAHVCHLVPGTFTHTLGDAHVYVDHVDALKEQIQREPRPFPTLEIARADGESGQEVKPKEEAEGTKSKEEKAETEGTKTKEESGAEVDAGSVGNRCRSIDGWRPEDFVVKGYEPHKGIAMKMSV